jgi:hypothetical protein
MISDDDTSHDATAQWQQALLEAVQAIAQHLAGAVPPAPPVAFRYALDQRVRYEGLMCLVEQQRLTRGLYASDTREYLLRPCAPGRETVWVLEAYISPVEDIGHA